MYQTVVAATAAFTVVFLSAVVAVMSMVVVSVDVPADFFDVVEVVAIVFAGGIPFIFVAIAATVVFATAFSVPVVDVHVRDIDVVVVVIMWLL